MFLSIRYVVARIYKKRSANLSRCYVDRTGGRIASYRRLTPPYLNCYESRREKLICVAITCLRNEIRLSQEGYIAHSTKTRVMYTYSHFNNTFRQQMKTKLIVKDVIITSSILSFRAVFGVSFTEWRSNSKVTSMRSI